MPKHKQPVITSPRPVKTITLKPYQRQILDELEFFPSIALLMGTGSGKTYTSLVRVKENGTKHLLVICPARVTEQWEKSVLDIIPEMDVFQFVASHTAPQRNKKLEKIDLTHPRTIIVSLETVAKMKELLHIVDETWTIIVDESHRIKEIGSPKHPVQVTQMCLFLGQMTKYKIILTATPTQKEFGGYIDYYAQLRFLGVISMSERQFKNRYCIERKQAVAGQPYPINVIIGYKNTKELDNLLELIARRYVPKLIDGEPEFIKISLPKPRSYNLLIKTRAYENLKLENVTSMRIAKKTLTSGTVSGYIEGEKKAVRFHDNDVKRDWVEGFLSDTSETVIIFYKYNVELDILKEVCEKLHKKYIVINGDNGEKLSDIENAEYSVVLGQYKACGESIDGLQYRSHICVYYAMPESSLEYVQSLGRINRIGQEKLPMYYHLVMDGTIDEKIYDLTLEKVAFNEEVLDRITI